MTALSCCLSNKHSSAKMNFLMLSLIWAFVFFETSQSLVSTGTMTTTTRTVVPRQMNSNDDDDSDSDSDNAHGNRFPNSASPHLAIITEPDACDSRQRMEQTFQAIQEAVSTGQVDLVSIRLTPPRSSSSAAAAASTYPRDVKDTEKSFQSDQTSLQEQLAFELTRRLVELSRKIPAATSSSSSLFRTFRVVCSSDWVHVALQAQADGIHVKEKDLSRIPDIRHQFSVSSSSSSSTRRALIGTSAHSVESAVASYQVYRPDYYFVGTCYQTVSHPEKNSQDLLEGPTLPGQVRRALLNVLAENNLKSCVVVEDDAVPTGARSSSTITTSTTPKLSLASLPPKILAIGGINECNCHEPVIVHGADGVAVIRAVLAAVEPSLVVTRIQSNMRQSSPEQ